ncbi:MAG: glycerate kinase, partial [Syntrophothermus sp.]
ASKIILGIGGTGTSDLGLGLCVPFGLRLLDKNGIELEAIPQNYPKVKKIILPGRLKLKIEVVLDVKVPLFGRNGTSRVFSPQKGASPEDVNLLEKGVKNILRVLKKEHGLDFENTLIGAGGGLTLGLMLISVTKVITSREFLVKKLGLRQKIRRADLVVSGEGKLDYQSYLEKATGIVIEETLRLKKRIIIIAGSHELPAKYKKDIEVISLMDFYKSRSDSIKNYKTGIEKAIISCHL